MLFFTYISQNSFKGEQKNKSENREDQKQIKEVNLNCTKISETSDIPDDIFTESLNSNDFIVILFSCLKILESKIRKIPASSK